MTPITLTELITQAGEKAGSLRKLAELMGKNQNRISEWRTGKAKPDAHEIAYLAETAGLPVLQTVAEIESQLDSRYAEVWRNALGKLTAAGVAASFVGALAFAPDDANSRNLHAVNDSYAQKPTVYIMSTNGRRRESRMGRVLAWLRGMVNRVLHPQFAPAWCR